MFLFVSRPNVVGSHSFGSLYPVPFSNILLFFKVFFFLISCCVSMALSLSLSLMGFSYYSFLYLFFLFVYFSGV
jgi:hypothetical protein